ncbi:aldehyde dehydrogenase domain-containing protein [Protomyces lactucae-debilis]|uniref:Aldehyde dehydrogenase domain-containing protein n=1 Tax=Protomyces lactucae-debilis TaxID=2754530 RepID=A0A1Y2FAC0_PROLT|nr:aldehyde dehydrogenase domain-containing protein [Protomyces lactucae-debilis]ORY80394.1 aldehyde dehydrogenase domain-containing protein [Protomyces lactucae-debilis]
MSFIEIKLPSGKSYTQPTGLFINNKFVDAKSAQTFATFDPATGREICQVAAAQKEDVDDAVAAAKDCFENVMEMMDPSERGRLLYRFSDAIEANKDILAAIESLDGGKPLHIVQSDDLTEVLGVLRYYAGWADKIHGKHMDTGPGKLTYTVHEPIGVCGQIIPFNFPLSMLSWKLAPAIATGNTVVLKVADQTPLSALYLCNLIKDIFPAGAINVLSGQGDPAGTSLVAHPDVRKIAFTGSTAVGRQVMKACADSPIIKKVTLELGGKSPLIVAKDANLEQAAKWAHSGMFYNNAQVCSATTRILVDESVYDAFSKLFVEQTSKARVGQPSDLETFQGPQISAKQHDKILEYVESGKQEGADVLLDGGKSQQTEGYFIDPVIFGNVKPDMRISREEIFGPVAVLTPFTSMEEAIQMANDTSYGLGAAIFSESIRTANKVARKLKAGQVWINCTNVCPWQVPFGGYKSSGIGRELGEYALSNYTEVKSVIVWLDEDI